MEPGEMAIDWASGEFLLTLKLFLNLGSFFFQTFLCILC